MLAHEHPVGATGSRIPPGSWDNNGRCCHTAGLLPLAWDRITERGDDITFPDELVDERASRATTDHLGVHWSNHEHRVTPSNLPPSQAARRE